MKIIYTDIDVPIVDGDECLQVYPEGFIALNIVESHEEAYRDYLTSISQERRIEIVERAKKEQIAVLWDACNNYLQDRMATLGIVMLKSKQAPNTKAQAILQWVQELWDLYYIKRDQIMNMKASSPFFNEHGDLPYSYKEAMEEQ